MAAEGYVYNSFGHPRYLKHAVASVHSLRRYDDSRPVALVCQKEHRSYLEERDLTDIFDIIHIMEPHRASIVGFKHNIHDYLFFDESSRNANSRELFQYNHPFPVMRKRSSLKSSATTYS